MKTMKISVSPYDKSTGNLNLGQNVFYINVNGEFTPTTEIPTKISYGDRQTDKTVCLINYEDYTDAKFMCDYTQGYAPIKESDTPVASVYKREVSTQGESITTLTRLKPVNTAITHFKFKDFNISNRRQYQYVLYPTNSQVAEEIESSVVVPERFNWDAWSITELHPVNGSKKQFTASDDDVWLFNLNVDTGEQAQNISRTEQQTLGQFNKYSHGRTNYVTGSVSCLLGNEVIPTSYLKKHGYTEKRIFDTHPTSNESVDMLLAWRKVVFSPNPKLLKDRSGQSFLVTLNTSSNKPMDYSVQQANTISFTWTQIGETDGLQITGGIS